MEAPSKAAKRSKTRPDAADDVRPDEGPPAQETLDVPAQERIDEAVNIREAAAQLFGPELLAMMSDEPIDDPKDDLLDYDAYAQALVSLIENKKTTTPLTIAINAPWGGGKSSLARLVDRELQDRPRFATTWFNAWQHDATEDLGKAFLYHVANEVDTARTPLARITKPLPRRLRRPTQRKSRVLKRGGLLATGLTGIVATLFHFVGGADVSTAAALTETVIAALVVGLPSTAALMVKQIPDLVKPVKAYFAEIQTEAASGSLRDVQAEVRRVVADATRPRGGQEGRVVVFVDDIDRVAPPKAIEILEMVNLYLAIPGVVVVILGDMPAVAAAAEIKYRDMAQLYSPGWRGATGGDRRAMAYGRHYLQKFVQIQFDIPPQSPARIMRLVEELRQRQGETREEPTARTPLAVTLEPLRKALGDGSLTTWPIFSALRRTRRRERRTFAFVAWAALSALLLALIGVRRARRLFSPRVRKAAGDFLPVVIGVFALATIGLVLWAMTGYIPLAPWHGTSANSWEAGGATFGITLVLAVASAAQSMRSQNKEAQAVAKEVRSAVAMGNTDVNAIVADLKGKAVTLAAAEVQVIARREVHGALEQHGEEFALARWMAAQHLPMLPRNVKRMMNRLRLILNVAYGRNLFDGLDRDERRSLALAIGKWVALHEHFPEIARVLAHQPDLLASIESDKVDAAKVKGALDGLGLPYGADPAFLAFLTVRRQNVPVEHRRPGFESVEARLAPYVPVLTMFDTTTAASVLGTQTSREERLLSP